MFVQRHVLWITQLVINLMKHKEHANYFIISVRFLCQLEMHLCCLPRFSIDVVPAIISVGRHHVPVRAVFQARVGTIVESSTFRGPRGLSPPIIALL